MIKALESELLEGFCLQSETTEFSVVTNLPSDVLLSQGEAPNYHRR